MGPREELEGKAEFRRRQLRITSGWTRRGGAFWAHAWRVHGRDSGQRGPRRTCGWRNALSRRSRGPSAASANRPLTRASGKRISAAGRGRSASFGLSFDLREPQESLRRGSTRTVSAGPLLSFDVEVFHLFTQSHRASRAPRAARRHSSTCRALCSDSKPCARSCAPRVHSGGGATPGTIWAGRATYGSSRMRWCKPSCGLKKRRRSRLGSCHFRAPSRGHKPVLSEQRLWRSRSAFWPTRWRHMGATAPAPRERWGFHAKDSTESSSAWVFRAGLSPDDKVGAAGTAIPNTKKDPGARLPLRSPPPPLSSGTKTAVAKTLRDCVHG